ncbi:ABC transporter permease [Egibacter rhizosphaerae]|uniref:ABC transporter permease n=1 Tax=Egibacter rhizosphaerae TaxID=1670831 RepID=A0A411YHR2_9ACTN|nr:ABC transporter permease [Egibacter rhizosphaerae]QBI20646.1 ABC transporter permease [Egibacter rhizosphaerae]
MSREDTPLLTDEAAAPGAPPRVLPITGPVPAPFLAPALMVLIFGIVMAVFEPSFFAWGNLRSVLLDAALYLVLGVGMTFVITARGIDLSIGGIIVFSGVVMSAVILDLGMPAWVGMLACLAAGAACGLFNGLVIQKAKVPDLIVTLASEFVFRGLALIYAGGQIFYGFPEAIGWIGSGRAGPLPIPIIIGVLTILAGHAFLTWHRYGVRLHAVGGDPVSANQMGIDVPRYRVGVYVIMGLLAGLGSIILAGRLDAVVASGQEAVMLHTIAAVIVGGTRLFGGRGTILGTLLGAVLLSMIGNAVVMLGFESFWQLVASGVVIIVTIALYAHRERSVLT